LLQEIAESSSLANSVNPEGWKMRNLDKSFQMRYYLREGGLIHREELSGKLDLPTGPNEGRAPRLNFRKPR
jgi:hypothetical protein